MNGIEGIKAINAWHRSQKKAKQARALNGVRDSDEDEAWLSGRKSGRVVKGAKTTK